MRRAGGWMRAGGRGVRPFRPQSVLAWTMLAAAVYALTYALALPGLASPSLFAALMVGIAYALLVRTSVDGQRTLFVLSQAVIGVGAGSLLHRAALETLANSIPFLLFSVLMIALSFALGLLLARATSLDPVTASFGMVGGGAAGIVAISRELGADDRLVATMQYVRVVIIVATLPILAAVAFGASTGSAPSTGGAKDMGFFVGFLFVAATASAGLLLAKLARLPTGALLGPMIVGAAIALASPASLTVPRTFQDLALAGIGLSVGLRFTRESLRVAGQTLPAVVAAIVAMMVVCGVAGVLLAPLAHVSELAGYLATSPGGLSVAVGIAVTTEADGPFVVSMQVLRLFLLLLAAPLLARSLARWQTGASG